MSKGFRPAQVRRDSKGRFAKQPKKQSRLRRLWSAIGKQRWPREPRA